MLFCMLHPFKMRGGRCNSCATRCMQREAKQKMMGREGQKKGVRHERHIQNVGASATETKQGS